MNHHHEEMLITGGVGAVVVALVFWVVNLLNASSCESTAKIMGLPFNYGIMSGCMVRTSEGRWVPIRAIREVNP